MGQKGQKQSSSTLSTLSCSRFTQRNVVTDLLSGKSKLAAQKEHLTGHSGSCLQSHLLRRQRSGGTKFDQLGQKVNKTSP
jgi:hypothetical protein